MFSEHFPGKSVHFLHREIQRIYAESQRIAGCPREHNINTVDVRQSEIHSGSRGPAILSVDV